MGFSKAAGINANGASGGLWVGWKKEAKMSLVMSCSNFVILLVKKYNGILWYLVLFYGEPNASLRRPVLLELVERITNSEYPFIIIGDFNQVDYACDKLSANKNSIPEAYEFNSWRLRNELLDIPFKGPRFTWCNNRKGEKRVYERIDKALGSKDWFFYFPSTVIKHYRIQISDHAPIELDLNLTKNITKKLYKVDAWALEHLECIQVIREAWLPKDVGSPAFSVMKKLSMVRQRIKKWSLDKRQERAGKWEEFDKRLEEGMKMATTTRNDLYTRVNEEVREFATAAAIYWKQRAEIKWMIEGDTCTKFFFN
ncbi:uncharacterized protein LOC141607446 [Silene latifolia]|uniref:uncharacterized protein LOC141607446 n=1 Tax=Silene latifolia TaxID=37657 RepID=UPI003D7821CE